MPRLNRGTHGGIARVAYQRIPCITADAHLLAIVQQPDNSGRCLLFVELVVGEDQRRSLDTKQMQQVARVPRIFTRKRIQ